MVRSRKFLRLYTQWWGIGIGIGPQPLDPASEVPDKRKDNDNDNDNDASDDPADDRTDVGTRSGWACTIRGWGYWQPLSTSIKWKTEKLKLPYTVLFARLVMPGLATTIPSSYIMESNWSTQVSSSVIEGSGIIQIMLRLA